MCNVIKVDWAAWAEADRKSRAATGARGFVLMKEERENEERREAYERDLAELAQCVSNEPPVRGPKGVVRDMLPGMYEWLAERGLR